MHKEKLDIDYIEELMIMPIHATTIAQKTNIQRSLISLIREGARPISHLQLRTSAKLIQYYQDIKTWMSLEDFEHRLNRASRDKFMVGVNDLNTVVAEYAKHVTNPTEQFKILVIISNTFQGTDGCQNLTPDRTPKKVILLCNQYSMIPPVMRSMTDFEFMEKDLAHKRQLAQNSNIAKSHKSLQILNNLMI